MDIVILHCHFQRGGVTQVVENHVRALSQSGADDRIFLVSDQRDDGLSEETRNRIQLIRISGFDYDERDFGGESVLARAEELAAKLQDEMTALGIRPDSSVLHWNNHSLGKNTAAPALIRRMAADGWRLLLQVHDFAEDNRPENYRRLIDAAAAKDREDLDGYLYPIASQIHYAALTGGDASVLSGLGIPENQTHCLPNCVTLASDSQPDPEQSLELIRRVMNLPSDARWCLYPVRGIRRKNVGEFLLLCRWLGEQCYGGLTLCPTTEIEKRSYERWRNIATHVSARAVFDAAHHPEVTFADNLAGSDFVLSTSVAEGFGMAFLEPWLAGRGVIARRLPTVTDDFEAAGVQLSALYSSVPVPGEKTWLDECRDEIRVAFEEAWSAVPAGFRPDPQKNLGGNGDAIDFARLTPRRQAEVLRRSAASPEYESGLKELSRELIGHLHHPPDAGVIAHNSSIVGRHYSTAEQGKQLRAVYHLLLEAEVDSAIGVPSGAGRAVDLVTGARPYYPCRTEALIDG